MSYGGRFASNIYQITENTRLYISKKPFFKDALTTTVLSIFGKAVGFLVPFFVAAWFGIGTETDAFFFAYGLVLFLTGIFAPVVESVIVPFIAEIKSRNEAEVKIFLGSTLVLSSIFLLIVGVFLLAVSKPLLGVVTDFPRESIHLIFWLLVETMPLLVLLVGTSLLSGALNAYKLFAIPAISPAFRALVTLTIIFVFKERLGTHSIAIGYVMGEVLRLCVLLHCTRRREILSIRKITFEISPKLIEFFKTSSYQVAGMVAVAFNPIVDKTMASWLSPGNVSVLEYGNRLYQVPMTLISSGLFVVLLSHWSDDYYQNLDQGFKKEVIKTAKFVGGGALFISCVFLLLSRPMVNLVYGHGKFPAEYLPQIVSVWGVYLLGLGPTIFGLVFVRALLVRKNTRTLMILSLLNCLLNVTLNALFMGSFGVIGLAASTTITYTIVSFALYRTFSQIP